MKNNMKLRFLKLTCFLLVSLMVQQIGFAQSIDLSVKATGFTMKNGGWGSNCGGNDGCPIAGVGFGCEPDPRISMQAKHSGASSWSSPWGNTVSDDV
ncbi:MAG: hypothetical protein H6552_08950 [Chitinophagales bacterium]|nr:hypothetical protein [Chitinophagales bacterium]